MVVAMMLRRRACGDISVERAPKMSGSAPSGGMSCVISSLGGVDTGGGFVGT
jgi:hypothetical protein